MYTQSIFQAGNSNVVTIPKQLLSDLKIRSGDKVTIDKSDDSIIIKRAEAPKTKKTKSEVEFQNWLKVFLAENSEILDELANR